MKARRLAFLSWLMPVIAVVIVGGIFLGISLTKPKYKLSFMVDDSVYHEVNLRNFEKVGLPKNPTKQDYNFDGWFFDAESFSNPFDEDYFLNLTVEKDYVVYAKFSPTHIKPKVTFLVEGNEYDNLRTDGNEGLVLPQAPTKQDYTFAGWFFDDGVWEKPFDANTYISTTLTDDVIVYAKFEPNPIAYTLTFMVDETAYDEIITFGNKLLTLPPNPTLENHIFEGWFFDFDTWKEPFTTDSFKDKPLTEDTIIYAKFSEILGAEYLKYTLSATEEYYIVAGRGTCTEDVITIPETYDGLPVTQVGYKAFFEDETITKVVIPKSVTYIDFGAFRSCLNLTEVVFEPNSTLETIGQTSFYGMGVLKFTIPKSVKTIESSGIARNEGLTEIVFEEGTLIETLGSSCFSYNTALTKIKIPKQISTLSERMFDSCTSLSTVEFEDASKVTELSAYCFFQSGIVELTLSNLETIGENCFTNCEKLSNLFMPKTMKTIASAFSETRALKTVVLEDYNAWCSVEIEDTWAVPWLYGHRIFDTSGNEILNLNIKEGITKVNKYCFYNCYKVETITLPKSLTYIDSSAFANVLYLKYLNIFSTDLNVANQSAFRNLGRYTLTVMGPGWTCPEGYRDVAVVVGEDVTTVCENLFGDGDYPAFIGSITFKSTTPPTFGTNWLVKTSSLEKILVPTDSFVAYSKVLSAFSDYLEAY